MSSIAFVFCRNRLRSTKAFKPVFPTLNAFRVLKRVNEIAYIYKYTRFAIEKGIQTKL